MDKVFLRYGFGDDDPTNDLTPDDKLWNQFVDELFQTIEEVLENGLSTAPTAA